MLARSKPAGFTPLTSPVRWAQFGEAPPFASVPNKQTGKRRSGQLYEVRAHEHIQSLLPQSGSRQYLPSQWIAYQCDEDPSSRIRFCQPDGIIVDLPRRHITLVEVKLQHTAEAWWQLKRLYYPVLGEIYKQFDFSFVEVVRWLDPHIPFPEPYICVEDVYSVEPGVFGVHIFTPSRARKRA